MKATIEDVARRCGIEPAVVRRVLGARLGDVDEETRRRIVDEADALGVPSPAPTRSLGIVYSEESGRGLTHPFFALILNAFKFEAEAHDYDIAFISSLEGSGTESTIERCRRLNVDGVCLVCVDFDAPRIKDLVSSDIPCLTIDHVYKGVAAVLSDNETGVQKLVTYAISKGHRRIAFVHGQNNSIVTRTRLNQFYNSMAFNHIELPEGYVREGLYNDIAAARTIVHELLDRPDRPTCILLPEDLSYLGAQEAARQMGLRIPEDISFAGYDGIPLTQALTPRLTTIRQSCDSMGRVAARRLIDLIENPRTASRMPSVFPVELVEGGTIGPYEAQ